jgi:hypothetical protein
MQSPQMIRPQQSNGLSSGKGFSEDEDTRGTSASRDAQVQQASWDMILGEEEWLQDTGAMNLFEIQDIAVIC